MENVSGQFLIFKRPIMILKDLIFIFIESIMTFTRIIFNHFIIEPDYFICISDINGRGRMFSGMGRMINGRGRMFSGHGRIFNGIGRMFSGRSRIFNGMVFRIYLYK